jgi:ribosome production factor 1
MMSAKKRAGISPRPRALTTLCSEQAEHEKKPDGLDIINLPDGPHFHFSVSNWIEGKKLPRHANDTGHYPE